MVKQIGTKTEFDKILEDNKDKLVVVDFTASWCPPCQMIKPIFEKMEKDYPEVTFIKVDVDENKETASACGIQCMPTFKFYKKGSTEATDTMEGADKDGLKKKIEELK